MRQKNDGSDPVAIVMNLTPVPRAYYRLGLPRGGKWREILNSDAAIYSGSNMGNWGQVYAQEHKCHNQNYSAEINLPPLSILLPLTP